MYDVSQLPVMDKNKVVGILNETDILLAVQHNQDGFKQSVSKAMNTKLATVQASYAIETLEPIFQKGMVAIAMEGDTFLGLITPIDLLQYLRKKAGLA
jgi:cystathionine beta-synthase